MTAKSSTANRLRGCDDASRFDSVQADERGAEKSFRVFEEGISRSCDGRLANATFITSSNSTAVTESNNPARNSVAVGEKKGAENSTGETAESPFVCWKNQRGGILAVISPSLHRECAAAAAACSLFSLQPAEQSLALRLCEQMI